MRSWRSPYQSSAARQSYDDQRRVLEQWRAGWDARPEWRGVKGLLDEIYSAVRVVNPETGKTLEQQLGTDQAMALVHAEYRAPIYLEHSKFKDVPPKDYTKAQKSIHVDFMINVTIERYMFELSLVRKARHDDDAATRAIAADDLLRQMREVPADAFELMPKVLDELRQGD